MNKKIITLIVLCIGACLIGTGLILGQNSDVLTKAVKICLECVGIG